MNGRQRKLEHQPIVQLLSLFGRSFQRPVSRYGLAASRSNRLLALCALALVCLDTVDAQHQVGRWMVGGHAIANMWFNDLNQRIVGLGGGTTVRYGATRQVSFGLEAGLERLKTGQDPPTALKPNDYLRLNAFHISALGFYHFLPGKPVAPFLYAGAGMFSYTSYAPIQQLSWKGTSIRVPVGVGIETFVKRGLAYNFTVGYVVMNDAPDAFIRRLPDGYVDVRFGLNLYIGSSNDEDDDGDGLTNAQEHRMGTNPTNPDTDEDGLRDKDELAYVTDPANPDTDGDKLKDGEEVLKYLTNPLKADTDGDGYEDGEEVYRGSNSRDAASIPKPESE